MGELSAGDRARVQLDDEGEVVGFDNDGNAIVQLGDLSVVVPPATLTKLTPPTAAGDTIEGSDAFDALPIGSLIAPASPDVEGEGPIMRVRRGYVTSTGVTRPNGSLREPRKLLYVPGVPA
jgi:hypothetical protein